MEPAARYPRIRRSDPLAFRQADAGDDYAELILAEIWAFIDRINSFYPPHAIDLPIEWNQEIYDWMSRAFHTGTLQALVADIL